MRRSDTGGRPDQGRLAARARRRTLGLEHLEPRALMAAVTEYPVTAAASQPYGIVSGPDGNLWFTEAAANNIASITPATGAVTEYPIPTANAGATQITAGPAGSNTLYFTENAAGQIGAVNVLTGAITEYPITPLNNAGHPAPFGITLGPDGNIWFTDQNASGQAIGEFNTATNAITETPVPTTNAGVAGIASGSDGNLWFVEQSANKLGDFAPTTPGAITETNLPTPGAAPLSITTGPDGNLWFTEQSANQIGTIIPSTGTITEYPLPTSGADPYGITSGPDGNVWFTEQNANQVGRISPKTGAIQEFGVPTAGAGLNLITTGPDDALWFTEGVANQIGRFSPAQILQATGTSITGSVGTAFTGVVATFTSAGATPQASDFSATIDWGDGTTTAATGIAPTNSGTGFNVAGTHAYTAQGTYTLTVTITDVFGDTTGATSTATISQPVTPPVTGPIPTVTGLVRTGLHNQPTVITLSFSSALNPSQADNALNYSIIGLGANNMVDTVGQVVAGRTDDQYDHVLTATYNATNNTVTLTTYEHLNVKQIYQIIIHSGPPVATANGMTPDGLQSPAGVYLAGSSDTPGTDYAAYFRGALLPVRATHVRVRHASAARRHGRHG